MIINIKRYFLKIIKKNKWIIDKKTEKLGVLDISKVFSSSVASAGKKAIETAAHEKGTKIDKIK